MSEEGFETISQAALAQRFRAGRPSNDEPSGGYALVNTLPAEQYRKEHIPGSINIPRGNEGQFEELFSRDKDIVVYCASDDCDSSPSVARELASRGFSNVYDFEGGMDEWKDRGGSVTSGSAPA